MTGPTLTFTNARVPDLALGALSPPTHVAIVDGNIAEAAGCVVKDGAIARGRRAV